MARWRASAEEGPVDAHDSTSHRVRWHARTIGWACERMKKRVVGGVSGTGKPPEGTGLVAAAPPEPLLLLLLLPVRGSAFFGGALSLRADCCSPAVSSSARNAPPRAAVVGELPARSAMACNCGEWGLEGRRTDL